MNAIDAMRKLLHYNPTTGEFRWTPAAPKRVAMKVAGCQDKRGCIDIKVFGKSLKAHRIAWAFSYGEWPTGLIDHKNGDPTDNRIDNLPDVSNQVNMQNLRKATPRNKSGFLGVCRKGLNWRAQITIEGKREHIGMYKTPEEAYQAYVTVKHQHHEGSTL